MEPIRLTRAEADSGAAYAVAAGDPVEVSLAEIPGTGYRWSAEVAPAAAATAIESRFSPGGPGVGAGGMRVFRFRFGAPGAARLRFVLRREWDAPGTAADQVEFELAVR